MLRAKVTSKGQVTLPKPLRDSLSVKEGDHLEIVLKNSCEATLRKMGDAGSSEGVLRHLAKKSPVTVEEMNAAIAEEVSDANRNAG